MNEKTYQQLCKSPTFYLCKIKTSNTIQFYDTDEYNTLIIVNIIKEIL